MAMVGLNESKIAIITCLENWPVMILFKVHRRAGGRFREITHITSPHSVLAKFRGDELLAAAAPSEHLEYVLCFRDNQRPFQFRKESGEMKFVCPPAQFQVPPPPPDDEPAPFLLI